MSVRRDLIEQSLECVAGRAGDITDEVYRRLFARHPEFEPLFVLDAGGAARGNMLAKALDALLELGAEDRYGSAFIQAECVNHEGIGVSRGVYMAFFETIREAVRAGMGSDWTTDVERAWAALLDHVSDAIRDA